MALSKNQRAFLKGGGVVVLLLEHSFVSHAKGPVPLYELEQEVCRIVCLDTSWRLL